MPGKPRQQTLNRHCGPRLALTAARFAHSSRAGGRRREGVPSRSRWCGKRPAERSLARAQRDVHSGPAASDPAASGGPTPATTRTPVGATRRPRPAPTRDGGSRSNKRIAGSEEPGFIAPGPGGPARSANVGPKAPGCPAPTRPPPPAWAQQHLGARDPPPGWIRTLPARRQRRRKATEGARVQGLRVSPHPAQHQHWETRQSNHPQPPRPHPPRGI